MNNKIIFIIKSHNRNRELARSNYLVPLGLLSIASMLRLHGYDVTVIDQSINNITGEALGNLVGELAPLYVAFSVYTENVDDVFKTAKYLRGKYPEIKICLGGPHATLDTQYCMRKRFVDFILLGDGEQSCLELAEAIRTDQKLIRYEDIDGLVYLDNAKEYHTESSQVLVKDLDLLPIISRDFITAALDSPMQTIYSSRGCPGHCIYCAAPAMSGGKYRIREIEHVFLEMLYVNRLSGGDKVVFFTDDTFTAIPRRVGKFVELCRQCSTDVAWKCESRVDAIAKNIGLLPGLKQAGCIRVQYGIESGNQTVLDKIHKQMSLDDARRVIAATVQAGIMVATSFMFAHYCDTAKTMQDTLDFMRELKRKHGAMVEVVFGLNTPFPGTYQYDHLEELGMTLRIKSYSELDMYRPVVTTEAFDLAMQNQFHAKAGQLMSENARG